MTTQTWTVLLTLTGDNLPDEKALEESLRQHLLTLGASTADVDAFPGQSVRAECDHRMEVAVKKHAACHPAPEPEARPPRRLPANRFPTPKGGGGGPAEPF